MKRYELNRKGYTKVRKMDHGQMSDFCSMIYNSGYEAGRKDAAGPSEDEIRSAILNVKGVGEKKAEDIMAAISGATERRNLTNG